MTIKDALLNLKKMRLKVDRRWKKTGYTIGVLYVNGIKLCETVEDQDRKLNSSMYLDEIDRIKIKGETAIPTGTYKVVLSNSPKFSSRSWAKKYGGLIPELLTVKGFEGIRIHPGNTADDCTGCILVGDNKIKGGVINSTKRYYELMDKYLIPAWSRKEEIIITIK